MRTGDGKNTRGKGTDCPFNDIPKELAEKWHNRLEEIGKEPQEFEIPIIAPDTTADIELCSHETTDQVERTKIRMAGLETIVAWICVTGSIVFFIHEFLPFLAGVLRIF